MPIHKGISIRNRIINIIIKRYNGITKIYNNKLFDFLSVKLRNCCDMKLNYEEFMENLYYNKYQNPPEVFSFGNKYLKLIWGILTYFIIYYNKDEFY